jgi:hypothetical protein
LRETGPLDHAKCQGVDFVTRETRRVWIRHAPFTSRGCNPRSSAANGLVRGVHRRDQKPVSLELDLVEFF